jgi:NAD(P)-dependent dehydrogenase (short-subunit alcohol dehydrogenase family)
VGSDLSEERLAAFADSHSDCNVVTVQGDISSPDVVATTLAAVADTGVYGLVNNAGIMDDFTPVHEVTDEVWNRVFRVNVTALMQLTRAVVPSMLAKGLGSIVNVTSEAGLRGSAAGVAYTASKHAVIGITKNCAVMYGPSGIRTNAVAPGATITNIEAHFASEHAMGRLGPLMHVNVGLPAQATQLAATITFLLSDDGTNVNGAIVPADGGWSAI